MRFLILFFVALGVFRANTQTVLFEDNFNSCTLSSGWSVQSTGNPNTVWYVGLSQNPLVPGQSIDSTCFLFIDDYSAGPATPGYVLDFITPAFDVTPYTTVECTMDVHFRFGDSDFLQIISTDGATETELARFDNYRTNGTNIFAEHFSLRHDLALVSQSANTRIIIRYTSPTASLGRYAGIDNIRITGSGSGTNVIREAFDNCTKPAGWETQILAGQDDWRFGRIELGSSAFYDGNSMDGSCFVYFDDAKLGQNAPASTIRLYSPWFDGDTFFHYNLTLDFILRYSGNESIKIYLQNSPTDSFELFHSNGQVGGPFFPDYVPLTFSLDPYRAAQMRLIFEYSDGGTWGYWTGIDNVKVTGWGLANEYCTVAIPLITGDTCKPADNTTAIFDGPAATCSAQNVGSLWYRWKADFTGIAKLTTPANFNDVVSIFTGTCSNLQPVICDNRDEHGFSGESTWFGVGSDSVYLIRVSGRNEGFGLPTGDLCIAIDQDAAFPPTPGNDNCANAVPITLNGLCPGGNNRNGNMATTLPSGNKLARADVWYRFTAGNLLPNQHYELKSNATFSNIITAYEGSCAALQEIACSHYGNRLQMPDLTPGQSYLVQIAGNFATIEDSLCPQLRTVQTGAVANDSCLSAIVVPIGGSCVAANNEAATFSGHQPSCAVSADRDIWFKFTAPASGSVHINTGADFRHTLALWQGSCMNLTQVYCTLNPKRCDGYVTVGSLSAGQVYYVQIATWTDAPGLPGGNVCLKILDGATSSGFQPLRLSVLLPCIGVDSALLSANTTGGTPPYTYTGNMPGQILSSGQPFLIVVTDNTGCEQYKNGLVSHCDTNICTLTVNAIQEGMSCPDIATGVLMANTNAGTGPFTFHWSNGAQTQNNSGLLPGTYTVTVTDALGCPATASATVGARTPPIVLISGMVDFCPGDSTVITASGGSSYVWSTGNATNSVTLTVPGAYTVTATDANGCTNSATVVAGYWIVNDPPVLVAVKVFLQGPYVSAVQLMHDSLRVKNLIPLQEPYTGLANFTHTGGGGGEQTTNTVLATTGPNAIVDWVFLELRNAANPAQVVATRSALLERDGDVVDVDGVSAVSFGIPPAQNYYLTIRHRNHLGVQLGAAKLYPGCVAVETDFQTLPPEGFFAYNGLNPAQRLSGSQYMLWAGNGRVDFLLKYNGSVNDRTAILSIVGLNTPNATVAGYHLTDYNLDGLVKYNGSANDRNVLLGNVGITTPSAILHDQIAR